MNNKPTLLVLAAGMGSRYGGLKQIDPVGSNGETIMDYSVYDALRAGFGRVVFVIRQDFEQKFREMVGRRFERIMDVIYAFQELDKLPKGHTLPPGRTKPWGTTHAILMAEDAIREPFATINADDFYGRNAYTEIARHFRSGTRDYAMVGFTLRNTLSPFGSVARGVCQVDDQQYLQSVVELTKIELCNGRVMDTGPDGAVTPLTGDEVVSMNFWGFTPEIFPQLRETFESFLKSNGNTLKSECYIPSTVGELVDSGKARVKVLRSSDSWIGMTYQEDRPQVVEAIRKLVSNGQYPEKLWQ